MGGVAQAVVIDEWALVRHGVEALLAAAGVGPCVLTGTATDGFAEVERTGATLLVIGSCADASVIDAVRRASGNPRLKVIALVGPTSHASLIELCSSGAHAVVLRSSGESDVRAAVEHVHRGERYLSRPLMTTLFTEPGRPTAGHSCRFDLTMRERSVLAELSAGRSNREIATTLCIGAETVKTHLGNIYAKLDVSRRDQAISVALRESLV
jgi:DNA-binding NarL/FixJ family response regulator